MATYAENLVTIRDNIVAALIEATANPKPSYTNGPRSVSWTEYMRMLQEQLDSVTAMIGRAEPVEVVTRVGPVH